ncbi:hypothetical protein [Methylovirgula sp. 4M-Z18]|uniref:hypothetical protein n=1 Tax=Methylovirgula sp. 4M-Z18 TaxID=2293567 RepID=UPI000E2F428A|nr:hypothetical protein [Methylovirgula sp. 4M-Z18]RFB78951.1 hypothetical protein DYH55_14065 [Methylovirgula sp. 4M-Z18]
MIAVMRTLLAQAFVAAVLLCAMPAAADISPWPPRDSGDGQMQTEITVDWAAGLRDAASFDEVQRRIGAKGRIESIADEGDAPRAVYRWTGLHGRGGITAFLYRTGDFSLVIAPANSRPIKLNSFGAYFCPDCAPPVQACGHRPSWVPHSVHWDNFDCPCTVTGPPVQYACEPP